ncbi:hypothetical protein IFR05_011667 [Cadophora sp. M221]|nr:hypothetical protein IFR05_011667 [Cadophora sp. M221]
MIHAITDYAPTGGDSTKEYLARDYLRYRLEPANPAAALEISDLWTEYKDGKTPEARRVREACASAYALQDGVSEDKRRTAEQIVKLEGHVSSPDLKRLIDLLKVEVEIPIAKTETAVLVKGVPLGKAYWEAAEKNFSLVAKVIRNTTSLTSRLPFHRLIQYSGAMKRDGWVQRGIKPSEAESNAGHSHRMAISCWALLPQSGPLNRMKCFTMSATHDMGEYLIGDLTPSAGIHKDVKKIHEGHSHELLVTVLRHSSPIAADEFRQCFAEFEEGETLEARFVHDVDTFEPGVQAVEYKIRYPYIHGLEDFLLPTSKIHSREVQELIELLSEVSSLKRRKDIRIFFLIGIYAAIHLIHSAYYPLGGPGVGKDTQGKLLEKELGVHHIAVGDLFEAEAKRPSSRFQFFIPECKRVSFFFQPDFTISLLEAAMLRIIETGKPPFRVDDNPDAVLERLRAFREVNPLVESYLKEYGPFETIPGGGSPDEIFALLRPAVEKYDH